MKKFIAILLCTGIFASMLTGCSTATNMEFVTLLKEISEVKSTNFSEDIKIIIPKEISKSLFTTKDTIEGQAPTKDLEKDIEVYLKLNGAYDINTNKFYVNVDSSQDGQIYNKLTEIVFSDNKLYLDVLPILKQLEEKNPEIQYYSMFKDKIGNKLVCIDMTTTVTGPEKNILENPDFLALINGYTNVIEKVVIENNMLTKKDNMFVLNISQKDMDSLVNSLYSYIITNQDAIYKQITNISKLEEPAVTVENEKSIVTKEAFIKEINLAMENYKKLDLTGMATQFSILKTSDNYIASFFTSMPNTVNFATKSTVTIAPTTFDFASKIKDSIKLEELFPQQTPVQSEIVKIK